MWPQRLVQAHHLFAVQGRQFRCAQEVLGQLRIAALLGDDGLVAQPARGTRGWWAPDLGHPWLQVSLLLVAAVALVVGWRTRVAAWVVVLLLVVLQRRNVYVLNSGDLLLRELAFFVALMPSGETWSLDRRRRGADLSDDLL